MPQILRRDLQEFLEGMSDRGITTRKVSKRAGELKATQREISSAKVLKMLKKGPRPGAFSIVSKDGYILDGHHGWATELTRDPRAKITVWQVDLPIHDLLIEAQNFGKTYHAESLDDFSIPEERVG
jgi:hypothetical protein